MNEYLCELAVNQIGVSPLPHDAAIIARRPGGVQEVLAAAVYRMAETVLAWLEQIGAELPSGSR